MKRTSSEPAYSANNKKSAARRKAKKRRARNRLILKVSAVMLLYVLLDRTTVHTAAVLFLPNGGQTTGWFCFSGFRR